MKKQNFFFSVFMALCAMTTLFTSCGGDDAPQQDPQYTPATARLACALLTDDATLVNFDFYVKWYDANGEVKSEKVVWNEQKDNAGHRICVKDVTAKLPATLGVYCEMKLKDGVAPQAIYHIAHGYNYSFNSYTVSGGIINTGGLGDYTEYEVDEAELAMLVSKSLLKFYNEVYQFDSKGGWSKSTWQ